MDEDFAIDMEPEVDEGAKASFKRPSQSLRPARLVLSESERVQRRWWNPDQLLGLSWAADSHMAPKGALCKGSLNGAHRRHHLSSLSSLAALAGGQATGQQLPG